MSQNLTEFLSRIENAVWGVGGEPSPAWRRRLLRLLRMVLVLARDLAFGQLTLRAMGLVYTTLLSLVPLLALSFSVLKAFGVYNQVEPVLLNFLAPLGEKGNEITARIIQFISNMNVGVLGSLGLALLLYTAVSLMQKIEESFNFIWHVSQLRSLGERFSRYLSVLLVGPILVFAAMGITATVASMALVRDLMSLGPLDRVMQEIGGVTPYVLVIAAFTFVYSFIPNTRVRLGPALAGGIVGGILWQTAGWAFATFVATSTQYAAIYSGFAILILFLIWVYVSWLVLLFGASVAFYTQHPEYLVAKAGEPRLSNRMRERLALVIMGRITEHFIAGQPAWTLRQLTQTLGVPMHAVQVVLDALEGSGLLARSGDEPPAWLPARDPSAITVGQMLESVRAAGEDRFLKPDALPAPARVETLMQRMGEAMNTALAGITVRDLVAPAAEPPASPKAEGSMPRPDQG
ncbi:MAG TPA: YhjD/YihY/BrkB family envelope integrity protein [Burkholderiales bacterium]|nr:YhjD/YihY/BrkB family envelope integrity protein [Burkholderiales bacterium]